LILLGCCFCDNCIYLVCSLCSRVEADEFSDVLDMEDLLLSDSSSVTERNESKNSENSCELLF